MRQEVVPQEHLTKPAGGRLIILRGFLSLTTESWMELLAPGQYGHMALPGGWALALSTSCIF